MTYRGLYIDRGSIGQALVGGVAVEDGEPLFVGQALEVFRALRDEVGDLAAAERLVVDGWAGPQARMYLGDPRGLPDAER